MVIPKQSARPGFTLIEVMVTVAIVGILASLSAMLMVNVNRYFILSKAHLELQEEARGIMYVITRNLRQAQNVTITIDQATNSQSYYSRITFTEENGTTMSFFQNGNLLVQQWGSSGQTNTVSQHLFYLAFSFPRSDDMTLVSVSMTLEKALYQGQKTAFHMASQQVQVMN
jgi:prepilin-type N-terminal cleavage/methylation domain-containing protein